MPRTFAAPPPPGAEPAEPEYKYAPDAVPDSVFGFSAPFGKGEYFSLDGIDYKVWSYFYMPDGGPDGSTMLVPVPIDYGFLGVHSLAEAAEVMAKAKVKYEAALHSGEVWDEGTGQWVAKTMHLSMFKFKKAILHAADAHLTPGTVFEHGGIEWFWSSLSNVIMPNDLALYSEHKGVIFNKAQAAMEQWGSVLDQSPKLAKYLDDFQPDEHEKAHDFAPMDEASLFEMFLAAEGQTGVFMFKGHEVWPTMGNQDTGEKYPVWNLPESYAEGSTDAGAKAIYPIWKKWKTIKILEAATGPAEPKGSWPPKIKYTMSAGTDPNIMLNALNGVVSTNVNTDTFATAPPFPGPSGKLPKWGPATAHFENKLAEALKLRLGPYATDSMVAAVTKDMLPVLHAYWEEVNMALVALKMTAAEQDKDVPSSIPGWKPSEDQIKISAAEESAPAAAKMEVATAAIWKSSLSPYLKKQYTLRIEFGIACGALPEGTTLETPYIDLWIMAVKKHTKKGEPPMFEDYLAATKAWQTALEGIST